MACHEMWLPRIQIHLCFRKALRSIPICILWGDSTLAPAHVALCEGPKLFVSGFLQPAGLSCTVIPVTSIAAGARGHSVSQGHELNCGGFPRAQNMQMGSVLSCALHCPAFLHCGHLALLGELFLRVSFGVTEHGDCLFRCQ